jgi:hypothetical protein
MITTTLVAECYRANRTRDDVAFYDTIAVLRYRLSTDLTVKHPVDPTQELTSKAKHRNQVGGLRDKLVWALEKLAVLHDRTCTEAQARSAWRLVFNHDFWSSTACLPRTSRT